MRWQLQSQEIIKDLESLEKLLLSSRAITDPQEFFNPPNPSTLDLEELGFLPDELVKASQLMMTARAERQKIVIFGDYDADGISATAILWRLLHAHGWLVTPFIPERSNHGYGLSQAGLKAVIEAHSPDIVLTVDNGIVAHQAVAELEAAGIKTIITDHHQPEKTATGVVKSPPASAVLLSTKLCGASVAWTFGRYLAESLPELADDLEAGLDMAGLATIADQVPLVGANRSFAYHGIRALKRSQRVGLKALLKTSGVDQSSLDTTAINFGLAPRINAMGRLEHGLDALRLLCTHSARQAGELASLLSDTNTRRQTVTADQLAHARGLAEDQLDQHLIVVASDQYHEGVIGLIAGHLAQEFSKPAIVMSIGEKTIKASARSLIGINVVELIRQVRDDLLEVGGHPMAAGFGLEASKLELVRSRLHQLALEVIAPEQLEATLELEANLDPSLLTLDTYWQINKFAPFGQGNFEPIWQVEGLEVERVSQIGREGKHLKILLKLPDGRGLVEALGWGMGEMAEELEARVAGNQASDLKLGVVLERNQWRDREKLQLRVVGVG